MAVGNTYGVWNGPMPTTAALVKVTTGTAIKTMLQLVAAVPIRVVEWGACFDGTAAATPVECELIDTQAIAATVTAYAVADVFPYSNPNDPANTAGSTGTPLNLGTALSGYTATVEGTTTATRLGDYQQIAPTNQYVHQWPLSREFGVAAGKVLRIRMTTGTAINALCYVIFEV